MITTGDGTDIVRSGAGDDLVNLGGGADEAVYTMADNINGTDVDVYQGGNGVDTLTLNFTNAEWLNPLVQTDIANYLAFQADQTDPSTSEADSAVFQFTAFNLSASEFEAINVIVDGVVLDPNAVAFDDTAGLNEDDTNTLLTSSVLSNDLEVGTLAYSVKLISGPDEGVLTFNPGTSGAPDGSYSFDPNDDFEDLAKGQTRDVSFVYEVEDAFHGPNQATVTITVTGTNDVAVITAEDLAGAVTELVTPTVGGNLSDSGTISFSDVDLTDAHLVSASGTPVGTPLGSLAAVLDSDTTGTGTGGQLTWTYTVADAAVEYLAAGQTKVESFTITLNDQNGGVVTKQIDVTITGTNDVAVITAEDLAGAVTELVTPTVGGNLSDSGTISFSDVDLTDAHLVSASGTPVGTPLGSLAAVLDSDTTGTGTGGQLTWTYTVADAAVEYLAAGQTKVESFTITLNDQNGGVVTKQIDVTITGTNDAPVVTSANTLAYTENDAATAVNAGITVTDVDDVNLLGATVSISSGHQSSEDTLAFTALNGITGVYAAGDLTLTGSATVAQYEAALASVTYVNTSEDPETSDREISFTVHDGDVKSAVATSTITVAGIDGAGSDAELVFDFGGIWGEKEEKARYEGWGTVRSEVRRVELTELRTGDTFVLTGLVGTRIDYEEYGVGWGDEYWFAGVADGLLDDVSGRSGWIGVPGGRENMGVPELSGVMVYSMRFGYSIEEPLILSVGLTEEVVGLTLVGVYDPVEGEVVVTAVSM